MANTDLRVIKTRNNLFNSLATLMKDKSFEEIKVSDICNEALINRSTFYSHYQDKYELLIDFINTLKTHLEESLSTNENISCTKDYYLKLTELLLKHIDEKKTIYKLIIQNNKNSILMDILLDVVGKDINNHLKKDINNSKVPTDVISTFYLGAFVSLGIEWLNYDNKYTIEDIINYLNELIPDNIN